MNLETNETITYSNHFFFEGERFAFRKKELFNISNTPRHVPFMDGFWLIKRNQLTKEKVKDLIKNEPVQVDVSYLQWYQQCELEEVFNL